MKAGPGEHLGDLDVAQARAEGSQTPDEVADEVGEPGESGLLEFRVLVPEVIHLPGFVGHHQVVLAFLERLLEAHEVGDQDLVHPSQRLEGVQVVLAEHSGPIGNEDAVRRTCDRIFWNSHARGEEAGYEIAVVSAGSDDDAAVRLRADDAAGRLHHAGHSGDQVGVGEAVLVRLVVVVLHYKTGCLSCLNHSSPEAS